MKYEKGSLYRTILKDFGGQYQEVIFQVIDVDYEHHKGYYEYLIKAIVPSYFESSFGRAGSTLWVKANELATFERLPVNHPAWLLYGKKTT